jgi:bacillithiol synthase
VIALLRRCYAQGRNIQSATFELVNELYSRFGLVVLIPDHPALKSVMKQVFIDDILHNKASLIVQETSARLEENFRVQANPREINLFYLKEDIRERIVRKDGGFVVHNTNIHFSEKDLLTELEDHPERFSPNVILRGLFQETILPNLVFIGGGGEMAYWLELKDLFQHYGIVYPVLLLRNSFLIIDRKWKEKLDRLPLQIQDLFLSEHDLMNLIVEKNSDHEVYLNGNLGKVEQLYDQLSNQASAIDPTLSKHVAALRARSIKSLQELEKKMVRAEKRRFSDHERQIKKIKEVLFPNGGLQERNENFSSFYARWGKSFIEELYRHSPVLEQLFTVLIEEPGN